MTPLTAYLLGLTGVVLYIGFMGLIVKWFGLFGLCIVIVFNYFVLPVFALTAYCW